MTTVFHLISAISKKAGVSCILVGGFAVNYYKYTRQTADVDFLITKEDFEKIAGLLKEAGYKQDYTQKVFTRLKSSKYNLWDIDFMFVDKETLLEIIKDGKEINIAGQKFTVPSLYNLIALKLHSIKYNPKVRNIKDLPDIINLIRINEVDFKSKKFQKLCLKYGTKEIYNEILESI
ncbi:MAG: nucleotidyltransferase [Candidatus Omnitrophota bacterium]|nr:MAG: nucleotidyltransferase [Candidatus Omnitrophota bacterium]